MATMKATQAYAIIRRGADEEANADSVLIGSASPLGERIITGIKPSASRDCSTYQFRYAALSELEFQQ